MIVRRSIAMSWLLTLPIASEAWTQQASTKFTVELEGGATWQSYNDVRIPNDASATRFSLRQLAGSGPWASGRLYLAWRPGQRHELRKAHLGISGSRREIDHQIVQFVPQHVGEKLP